MERLFTTEPPRDQAELVRRLQAVEFPPAQLRLIETPKRDREGIIEVAWLGCTSRFAVEYKAYSTPSGLKMAMLQIQRYARQSNLLPLVVVPYLSESSLQLLEAERVSGIDLCGNGVLIAPGLSIWRSGHPNRFKESRPIQNVFRGNSSLFARCFLLQPEFSSLVALRNFAQSRLMLRLGAEREALLTKGTASKVVQTLKEEAILIENKKTLRLVSASRLMERLRANMSKPRGQRMVGKTALSSQEVWNRLRTNTVRAVVTGEGSAGYYRLLSGIETLSLSVDNLEVAARLLEIQETRLFPNIELIEDKSEISYFDARSEGDIYWASPVQTWLELSLAGPRERDASQRLEQALLTGQGDTFV